MENKTILKDKYEFDVDDLYNPAYTIVADSDEKGEKLFEKFKEQAYHVEWSRKKPHAFNEDDTCEVGFNISGYYVTFMMIEKDYYLIRVFTACIDIDVHTNMEYFYMNSLNSSLIDFEERFGNMF